MCRVGFCVPNAEAIASAFQDDTRFSYVIPDEHIRRSVLPWFFRSVVIPACSAQNIAEGALWIRPGETTVLRELLHSQIVAAPFDLGSSSLRRAFKLLSRIDEVHSRLVRGPHWYLLAHMGHAALVLKPVLSRADSEGFACYVEVFDERNLSQYISLGFQFHGAGRVPGGGPNFWSMLRPPQNQIKM